MPKRKDIKKILVIGSGPITIGQAAEFDYAGTQACLSLREEGYEVIIVNSNPATIMTDTKIANSVYIEPLTKEFLIKIIREEKPDALLPTLGGQTGLNLAVKLHESGILDEYKVEILGTKLRSIKLAEDRDLFRDLMLQINEPVPPSKIVNSLEKALEFAEEIGFPVVVRPAYTMGGTGGGICKNKEELIKTVNNGLNVSPINQCLIEESVAGWKEIEYEVIRDCSDTVIVVANMENIDPIGIHTGDSMVVAPVQTLSDRENHLLRNAALKIIRALKIEGGCNIQFALNPDSFEYFVIEVNPRVSRSSALVSKATGYPIAKITAKIAIGLRLDEIANPVTLNTFSCFEPALDYIVTKIPRFPFDKFSNGNRVLGTQMKSTGEVMAIGRNFESSFLKALRSLEQNIWHPEISSENLTTRQLIEKIEENDDRRILYIFEALRRGFSIEKLNALTKIDYFFLNKFANIIELEGLIKNNKFNPVYLKVAKQFGFSDKKIASLWSLNEEELFNFRESQRIIPVFKMIDTCAAEFEAYTPYFYSSYEQENESISSNKKKIIVLGSGPIRIGQGIEFDYATVHAILEIKRLGYEAIVINNNPETVSTDFSVSDKLYFEPLTLEDVFEIIKFENPLGVLVQFGGQTAINLAGKLAKRGVKILGSSLESINRSEDREEFKDLLRKLDIPQPPNETTTSLEEGVRLAKKLGFPVLVRPSYVIGGRAMQIVHKEEKLRSYLEKAIDLNSKLSVLIEKYFYGKEVEVDGVSDGKKTYIAGALEHIELAGVHSGDSIALFPTQTISKANQEKIQEYTKKIVKALNVKGLFNIQFVIYEDKVYIIEVNLRSSRTVPILSKIKGVSLPGLAVKTILEDNLYPEEIKENNSDLIYAKLPIFSFTKLNDIDISLGPEMKSTGEVLGISSNLIKSLAKGFIAANIKIKDRGNILISCDKENLELAKKIAKKFSKINYSIFKTNEIKDLIEQAKTFVLDEKTNFSDKTGQKMDIFVSLYNEMPEKNSNEWILRQRAIIEGIPCFTSFETCSAFFKVVDAATNQVYKIN